MLEIILIILAILIILVVGIMIVDSNRFVIREYVMNSEKVSSEYNFLFISDAHCKEYGKNNCRLLSVIDKYSFDACFIAGDMVDAKPDTPFDSAINLIKEISNRMPIFYSYGNHEYRLKLYPEKYKEMYGKFCSSLNEIGVRLYDNEHISYKDIDIYALTIGREYYKRFEEPSLSIENMNSYIKKESNERFSVLLAHNPFFFETYAEWGADLTLSGHVHGGVIRIPFGRGLLSPNVSFFPKYDGGLFEMNGRKMIVNRGLGFHSIQFRLFNPAEIVIIKIKKH